MTVITKEAMDADILATGIFVMGAEKGIRIIEEIPGAEGIIIAETDEGTKIVVSRGLKGKPDFSY